MNRDSWAVFDDIAFISSILASKSDSSGWFADVWRKVLFRFYNETAFLRWLHFATDRESLSPVFCIRWTNSIFTFHLTSPCRAAQQTMTFLVKLKILLTECILCKSYIKKCLKYYSLVYLQLTYLTFLLISVVHCELRLLPQWMNA